MNTLSALLTDDADEPSVGLAVLCGAIAATVVAPLGWLFLRALDVEAGRARSLIFREATAEILFNSLALTAAVTIGSVLLGAPLAYLTVRTDLPFRRFFTVLIALPLVVPSYIGAFAAVSAFGPRGEFRDVLSQYGVESLPEIYGLGGATLVITLYTYPYVFLTVRAALLQFDTKLVEAARTLNHGRFGAFWRVTLPHLLPAIMAGALLSALYALSDFGTPAIMQLPVFTRQIYVESQSFGQDYAALLSLQLLALVLVILALESFVRPDDDIHSDGSGIRTDTISLGRFRWVATLFPLSVSGAALLIPLWILTLWVLRANTAQRPDMAFEWSYAVNSVGVAGVAALVAAAAAFPIAYYAARSDSRLSELFERVTYVGFAVPGIVLGFALIYFGTGIDGLTPSFAPTIYQTLPLLVFAYVVRFMPQSLGTIRTGITQVDPKLVDAARTLGDPPLRAFRRVTLRLVAPSLVAGSALVFLTTMKELPATLVLRPSDFETIITHIWAAQEAGMFQYAALPALLLVVVSGLSMVVLLLAEGAEQGL